MEDKIMTIINQITHEKRYEDANGLLISENIKIARNTVNMSLNQLYKKGLFIKINSKPILYLSKSILEKDNKIIFTQDEFSNISEFLKYV